MGLRLKAEVVLLNFVVCTCTCYELDVTVEAVVLEPDRYAVGEVVPLGVPEGDERMR